MSLGVSVDIVKAAVESAPAGHRPGQPAHAARARRHASSTSSDVDFIVPYDEPLLEYEPDGRPTRSPSASASTWRASSRTATPSRSATAASPTPSWPTSTDKKHLGVHTELLTDGIVELMKQGVIDNSRKTHRPRQDRGHLLHGHAGRPTSSSTTTPAIEFRTIDYTNNPLVIAQQRQHDRHQQRPGDRPDRPGHRRVDRQDLLQRHRRPGGLHARRGPGPGRQDHPGHAVDGRERRRSRGSCRSSRRARA